MERTRIFQLILDEENILRRGQQVFHLAPEAGLGRNIKKIVGSGYNAYDLNPKMYPDDLNVQSFDLVTDAEKLPTENFDLILHCHVMEHVPCDITSVMWHLHRALKPEGKHIFCVPIMPGNYAADFGSLSREERTARFGQFDHVRRYGPKDFDRVLGMAFNLRPYKLHGAMLEKMARHNIPEGSASKLDSNTFFILEKDDLKLRERTGRSEVKIFSRNAKTPAEKIEDTPNEKSSHHHTALDVVIADSPLISDRLKNSFKAGNYEVNEAKAMIAMLTGGERILELGGGVGVVSSAINKAHRIAAHHVVEADARLIPVMKETHRLNGVSNIEVHNCIVTSDPQQIEQGSVRFALAPNYTANSTKTVGIGRSEVEVPVVSLEKMVQLARPNVLLCDIEGAEVELLRGADLSMFDFALIEIHPPIIHAAGIRTVFDAMHTNGLVYEPAHSSGIFLAFRRSETATEDTWKATADLRWNKPKPQAQPELQQRWESRSGGSDWRPIPH
ncbi:FkbM family methyltransferase [Aquamicrobium sp. LC103]|uniref:class I SAM-dependent methyltransferase n=1 Tax=Aquamicrobium sp. LC103 TaxID=1120658 RepID=UPI0014856958|nr:FkbM family methyltransferase [Aquamicrobium sp. LC103]